MSPTSTADASVIVLAEGSPVETGRCLEALSRGGGPVPAEILVVDASPFGDAVPPGAAVTVVRADPAAGRAAALAAGAAEARGRLLVFLHGDAEPEPGWMGPLAAAAGGASPAVAGSRLTSADGTIVDGLLLAYAGPHPLSPLPQLDTTAASGSRGPLPVPAVSGVALAIPRALLAELGGFDAAFTAGGEDVDLCLRAGAAGVPVVVARASRVRHHGSCANPRPGQGGEAALAERWLGRIPLLDPAQLHGRTPIPPRLGRPAISVVVPVLDAGRIALRFIEALLRVLPQGDELVVADAGSTDGTRPLARLFEAEAPHDRHLVEAPGRELAAAARAGLAAARRPIVALLQPVEAPPDGLLDELTRLLQEHHELDLLAFPAPPAGLIAAGRRGAMQRLGDETPGVFFETDTALLAAASMERSLHLVRLG